MTATIDTSRVIDTGRDVIDLREPRAPAPPAAVAPQRGLGYLPALDGLRAIAVLGVLAYHADLAWAPGGFLGVDVFFVLSGFLITTLLLESAARLGSPDLREFYLRRARRLLPALFAVLIGSTLLVITVATDEAGNQQRDLPAALTYVTNWVYVLTDQSYFQATGRPPMLEHLWSLAVEEQFYLLWPWVFLLAWRTGRTARLRRIAAIGAVVSTGLMVVSSVINGYPEPNDPSRVYFGTDTHAMGLLVGAALATVWIPHRARSAILPRARDTVDAIGAAALLAVLVVFWQTSENSAVLYRGGFLLLSLLVAVLIVAVTHPASRVGVALGSAPLRYLGTRSYGIYLWHWPVFLVTRPGLDVPLTGLANLALRLGLTLAIAELSFRFLETPIRRHGFLGAWQALLAAMAARGGRVAAAAQRPAVILAVVAALLLGMTLRLYSLPTEDDSLGGVTSLSAMEDVDDAAAQLEAQLSEPPEPVAQPGELGLGESVMIGASGALEQQFPGIVIDAAVGRQEADALARTAELAAASALHETTIVHIGSNGPISDAGIRQLLDTLMENDVTRVAVVNISVPRRWQDPNNAVLASVVPDYPSAVLVDWHAAVLADPSLVNADGVHPSAAGVQKYADLIAEGLADLPSGAPADDGEPILQ